jgi:hypothetical protein
VWRVCAIAPSFVSGWRVFSSVSLCEYKITERDGRKGPPAGNKAKCSRTNTPHSKATQRKAKPNQTPQTHTRGARQAETTSAEGRARPHIGVQPAARVATYAPGRHRDALPRQRATPSADALGCSAETEGAGTREQDGCAGYKHSKACPGPAGCHTAGSTPPQGSIRIKSYREGREKRPASRKQI